MSFALQILAVPAVLGISAVCEFARRGGGTPVPFDPPKRLVTTGPYAYIANPMQTAMTLVFLGWGALLGSWWVMAAAAMAIVYSAGIAAWDEGQRPARTFRRSLDRLPPSRASMVAALASVRHAGRSTQTARDCMSRRAAVNVRRLDDG